MFIDQDEVLDKQLEGIHGTMYHSPGFFFIKDCLGRYRYLNKNMLENANLIGIDCVLGKTDKDTPWEEYALLYQKADNYVLKNESRWEKREIIKSHTGFVKPLVTQKTPFYYRGELHGVYGISLEIPDSSFNKNQPLTEDSQFIDLKRRKELTLTKQQKQTIHWVLQGLSSKEIARALNISYRTVEHHINGIKENNNYSSLKQVLLNVYPV
jgi:DNA-binding NarL/FixJ family response regulator